jgi:hypothetical protein
VSSNRQLHIRVQRRSTRFIVHVKAGARSTRCEPERQTGQQLSECSKQMGLRLTHRVTGVRRFCVARPQTESHGSKAKLVNAEPGTGKSQMLDASR